MPPSLLPDTRSVGEELLHLKDDLVVDETEEDGDNHSLRLEEGRVTERGNNTCLPCTE